MILREPIIRVLFQHGQFVAESTRLTARALLYYAIALPALATVKLVVPAFYSTRDTKTPVIVAAISMVINVVLNIVFLDIVSSSGCRTADRRWRRPWRATSIFSRCSYFPAALRPDGDTMEILRVVFEDFSVLGDHGSGLLAWRNSTRRLRCIRAFWCNCWCLRRLIVGSDGSLSLAGVDFSLPRD